MINNNNNLNLNMQTGRLKRVNVYVSTFSTGNYILHYNNSNNYRNSIKISKFQFPVFYRSQNVCQNSVKCEHCNLWEKQH